jgi:circadian clock protein KaiB
MPNPKKKISTVSKPKSESTDFAFDLYITGASPNSRRAVKNILAIFQDYIPNRFSLNIVDVYQQPAISRTVNLVALPLLVRTYPSPERRLIGDLSDTQLIINRLGLVKPTDESI